MDPHEAVANCIAAWNLDDASGRLKLLSSSCLPEAEFVSPQGLVTRIEALSAAIGAFRSAFPAAVVVCGPAEVHHGYARLRWETHWNDGRPTLYGDDFATLAADGRVVRLVSFDAAPLPPGG